MQIWVQFVPHHRPLKCCSFTHLPACQLFRSAPELALRWFSAFTHINQHVCVCVCVCARARALISKGVQVHKILYLHIFFKAFNVKTIEMRKWACYLWGTVLSPESFSLLLHFCYRNIDLIRSIFHPCNLKTMTAVCIVYKNSCVLYRRQLSTWSANSSNSMGHLRYTEGGIGLKINGLTECNMTTSKVTNSLEAAAKAAEKFVLRRREPYVSNH